ncbi:MAG: phosphomannomutase/phosphoglucomutase [Rhodospirillaceae bacterium]|jgi:phosphomannomutase|nr:phosphomannomutase/phosphoglucomutase [Rhodospirillaceae bacterium]MBT5309831.1 phosphomannomutase/phosphoglucomutase [Rhodospirillaceae bacterium]MBT7355566.1 phosphomannomutase/phosphoglucomutase [Rhodospirillaceae bacterium]
MTARKLSPTILREYDIRGIVDDTLDADDVRAIAHAFASIVSQGGGQTIAIGYDGRLSSPALEAAAVEGLKAAGMDVYRVGLGPSPMLYYATHEIPADAGMMITGSHNPPEYNGIKLSIGGKSFFGEDIQKLGRMAAAGDFVDGEGTATDKPLQNDYVARLLSDYQGTKELSVAWDAGNGAAGDALVKLVAGLPGRHVLLNETIDGTFPAHHPDPTVEANLAQLKQAVADNNCDLGIAFDGDGDRIGIVDGQGRVLWGDQMMVILASEVLADLPGSTIIIDVKASQVFFDEIERMGGKPMMWKTGHSLIKSKMAETGAPLAGEMSAHIFFKHRFYGFDDALYAAVRLLSIVASSDQSLADMLDAMPNMLNTPEIRFDCSEDRKFALVEEVAERLNGIEGITVHDMDGVRVQTPDGWWLLRASNTQAVLVARCESSTAEGLERLKEELTSQLRQSGLEPPDLN